MTDSDVSSRNVLRRNLPKNVILSPSTALRINSAKDLTTTRDSSASGLRMQEWGVVAEVTFSDMSDRSNSDFYK
jgi:hypothetical protein